MFSALYLYYVLTQTFVYAIYLTVYTHIHTILYTGNILLWKRKAEQYLISSGIPYTIIHPGGLLDKTGGIREIVFGIDDNLLKSTTRSIPREDVADVCIASLSQKGAINRAFDITSKEPGEGEVTEDWQKFFSQEGNCKYNYKYN